MFEVRTLGASMSNRHSKAALSGHLGSPWREFGVVHMSHMWISCWLCSRRLRCRSCAHLCPPAAQSPTRKAMAGTLLARILACSLNRRGTSTSPGRSRGESPPCCTAHLMGPGDEKGLCPSLLRPNGSERNLTVRCGQMYTGSGGMPAVTWTDASASSLMLLADERLLHCLSSPAR